MSPQKWTLGHKRTTTILKLLNVVGKTKELKLCCKKRALKLTSATYFQGAEPWEYSMERVEEALSKLDVKVAEMAEKVDYLMSKEEGIY